MPRSAKPTSSEHFHISRRKLFNLGIFLILLYIIVPQLGKFRSSLRLIWNSRVEWLIVALGLAITTYFLAAGIYCVLAKKPLRYGRTVIVQVAGMFVNRLLPAGVGAISVNYEYLKKSRHSTAEASAVVAVNNVSGFVGHMTLLVVILLATGTSPGSLSLPHIPATVYWIVLAAVLIIVLLGVWLRKLRRKILRNVLETISKIVGYGRNPKRLVVAWMLSMGVTILYVLCLMACAAAIGVHLSLVKGLIVLTLGVAGGTIAPTPGGLVGAEAGLVAGLVICNVSSADALAITLTYRLLTYWLPLILGPIAFGLVERRGYI